MLPSLYLFMLRFSLSYTNIIILADSLFFIFRSSFKSFFHGCIQVKRRTVMNLNYIDALWLMLFSVLMLYMRDFHLFLLFKYYY
jgi:hypothetical protein